MKVTKQKTKNRNQLGDKEMLLKTKLIAGAAALTVGASGLGVYFTGEGKLKNTENALYSLQQKVEGYDQNELTLMQKLQVLKLSANDKVQLANGIIDNKNKNIEQLKAENTEIRDHAAKLTAQIEEISKRFEDLRVQFEETSKTLDITFAQKEKVEKELANNIQLLGDTRKQLTDLQKEYDKVVAENKNLKSTNDKLGKENDKLGKENDKLGKENDKLAKENDKLAKENDKLGNQNNNLENEKSGLTSELNKANTKVDDLDKVTEKVKQETSRFTPTENVDKIDTTVVDVKDGAKQK
jgi:chromosome segregation ATPase